MTRSTRILAAALGLLVHSASAVGPVVDLTYSRYRGAALPNGITQWLGMRFAAPPLGELRFQLPQDPVSNKTLQDATEFGLPCLSTGGSPSSIDVSQSEDCLFVNVFAPSNATSHSKLPVLLYIQGGGFEGDANPYLNGSGLIQAGAYDMMLVTLNYRVGPYGLLTDGHEIPPNIALLDQRKAMAWTQTYISKFGGDPDHVVMAGDSAGAGSVALHLAAYGGVDKGLFQAAAAESPSFATVLTVADSQYLYQNFTTAVGCKPGPNALRCLQAVSASELQEHNVLIPYPGASGLPVFSWNPVIDGDLIRQVTYEAFEQGKFIKVPAIFGDDTNGGTIFTPQTTSTLEQSDEFLKNTFPYLKNDQIEIINALFPNPNNTCPATGCYWRQVSDAYGDMRYMCPAIFLSSILTRHGVKNSWAYRYDVRDPTLEAEGYGVTHTSEMGAIFGPDYLGGGAPASLYPGGINAPAVPVLQGYWSSFVRTFNPNTYRYPGTAKWETWTDLAKDRIWFQTGGLTSMEVVDAATQIRCAYLTEIGAGILQ